MPDQFDESFNNAIMKYELEGGRIWYHQGYYIVQVGGNTGVTTFVIREADGAMIDYSGAPITSSDIGIATLGLAQLDARHVAAMLHQG